MKNKKVKITITVQELNPGYAFNITRDNKVLCEYESKSNHKHIEEIIWAILKNVFV